MEQKLADGFPQMAEYWGLLESDFFHEIEHYSDSFVANVRQALRRYRHKWVLDSLHQWSRQWEYPYVIQQVEDVVENTDQPKILDLGSGVTFLPFYLESQLRGRGEIVCSDYDASIVNIFREVAELQGSALRLDSEDMRHLTYAPSSFDVAYSVSVLEHTDNYEQAIQSIHGVLKPQGKLILTFDLSRDGYDDIPLEKAHGLLQAVANSFTGFEPPSRDELTEMANADGILVSHEMAKHDKGLMPWVVPFVNPVRTLVRHRRVGRLYKDLTVYCLAVQK